MALNIGYAFDATQVDFESGKPVRWPIGDHVVKLVGGEAKQTNGKQSGYMELHLEIIQGPHKGKICSMRLSLWPEDPQSENGQKAIMIANQTIARLCHATNVYALPDGNLEHLFNIPFGVKATAQQNNDGTIKVDEKNEPYTEVKGRAIFDATHSPLRKGVPACTVPPAEQPVAYTGAPEAQSQHAPQQASWGASQAPQAQQQTPTPVAATVPQQPQPQAWQPQGAAASKPSWMK